ncbi:MAG: hypothetical protein A2W31_12630 [Planctomycetes bacterium RBG_16_64_10]|nr:MAG: hypothetical protein A2W31_12630 [Planctomycetes bacterium RBG_16_64_10]
MKPRLATRPPHERSTARQDGCRNRSPGRKGPVAALATRLGQTREINTNLAEPAHGGKAPHRFAERGAARRDQPAAAPVDATPGAGAHGTPSTTEPRRTGRAATDRSITLAPRGAATYNSDKMTSARFPDRTLRPGQEIRSDGAAVRPPGGSSGCVETAHQPARRPGP